MNEENYTEISKRLIKRMDDTHRTWFDMCVRWFREAGIPVENDMLLGHSVKVTTSDEDMLSVLPHQELNGFTAELAVVYTQEEIGANFIRERGYLTEDDIQEFRTILFREILSKGVDWAGLAAFTFSSETGLSLKSFLKITASYITGGKITGDALVPAMELVENAANGLMAITQIDTAIAFGDSSHAQELIAELNKIIKE